MNSLCLYYAVISLLISFQYLLEHFSQFAYASDIIGCNCTPLLCICIRHLLGIHISSDIPEECYDYSKSLFILTWFFYLDCFIAVWTSNINFQIVYPPNHLVLSFTIIVFVVVVVTDRISLDICLSSCYKYLDIRFSFSFSLLRFITLKRCPEVMSFLSRLLVVTRPVVKQFLCF